MGTFALMSLWLGRAHAAPEICNGIDDDSDGNIDDAPILWFRDSDGDGYGDAASVSLALSCEPLAGATTDSTDCDDTSASAHPGGSEGPFIDGIDEDCNGLTDDLFDPPEDMSIATDVDSTWLFVDGHDEWDAAEADCDGYPGYHLVSIDDEIENIALTAALPSGGDWWIGYIYDVGFWIWTDGNTSSYTRWAATDPNGLPNEACVRLHDNGIWYNESCDDDYDWICERDCTAVLTYADADGDGFGDPLSARSSCNTDSARVRNALDCNDTDSTVTAYLWYEDNDSDGYGQAVFAIACESTEGALASGDCDDEDPLASPGGTEVCGGSDEDCDTLEDAADPSLDLSTQLVFWVDSDGDSWGAGDPQRACSAPSSSASRPGDCDDTDPSLPDASGACDPASGPGDQDFIASRPEVSEIVGCRCSSARGLPHVSLPVALAMMIVSMRRRARQ